METGQTRRILVVDDNRDAATTLGELLELLGHEVRVAHDGLEALDAAITFRPDVAVLDIGLPKLDGFEIARRIREKLGRSVVLVALTGYGQDEDRKKSADASFDHHFVKPLRIEELEAILAKAPGAS